MINYNYPRNQFEELTYEDKIEVLQTASVYLMSRRIRGYCINLYGFPGYYVEVWYASNQDEICRIEVLKDLDALDDYLNQIRLVTVTAGE